MVSMNPRFVFSAIVATAAAATLTACASSSPAPHTSPAAGKGTSANSTSASSAPTTSAAAAPAGDQATSLATSLKQTLATVKSFHLTLNVTAAGAKITGTGDEKLAGGKLAAFQITENIPGGQTVRIVYVDGKIYAKLPRSLSKSSKPYVLVSPNSTNPMLRGIAQSLDSALQSASAQSASVFAQAASSVRNLGKTTVGGQQVTHYAVVVDPKKLPASLPGRSTLAKVGVTSIPVDMYLDNQNRPVQISSHTTVLGKSTNSVATISRYDQPVAISAPPAGEVAAR
ncbi:hypothetical protein [uncultured Jatrophihabitans sp.]|uniref:hypothetical protein n=1 Tax=uncultured Jatrophihabitans sp. TaxID=1610747 RepID=UPI0035CA83BA